jgi:hypothetical protein
MQSIQARSLAGRWRMRDEVPEAQHTQTMELSPGKSEYPARVLERSCHGGRAGSENLDAFLTRAPNSKGWWRMQKFFWL